MEQKNRQTIRPQRVAIYARVSTSDGRQDTDNQIAESHDRFREFDIRSHTSRRRQFVSSLFSLESRRLFKIVWGHQKQFTKAVTRRVVLISPAGILDGDLTEEKSKRTDCSGDNGLCANSGSKLLYFGAYGRLQPCSADCGVFNQRARSGSTGARIVPSVPLFHRIWA